MTTYLTWYSTGEYGKLWFDADSEEQAEELLEQVRNGELTIEELPNYEMSVKGGDGFEFDLLRELRN
jgi:NAD kinase